jgi:hypothetical protein
MMRGVPTTALRSGAISRLHVNGSMIPRLLSALKLQCVTGSSSTQIFLLTVCYHAIGHNEGDDRSLRSRIYMINWQTSTA